MGQLTPGTSLIYERVGPVVYAREAGQTERKIVGYEVEHDSTIFGIPQRKVAHILDIQQMAERDPGMKELWDQLEVMYNLKKTHE